MMSDCNEVVSLDTIFPSGMMKINDIIAYYVFYCLTVGFDLYGKAPYGVTEVI